MNADTIEKVEKLIEQTKGVVEVGGLPYTFSSLKRVKPPQPEALQVMSLESLVNYVQKADVKATDFAFHVGSPTVVSIVGLNLDAHMDRATLAKADVTKQTNNFRFGSPYDYEEFVVALQSCFHLTETRTNIIDCISKVRVEDEDEIEDDGFSQKVAAKAGVVLKSMISLPNPIKLKPYCTFPEIEPPEMSFVFRIEKSSRDKVLFKLHSDKSLAWELQAVADIKEYLKKSNTLEVF